MPRKNSPPINVPLLLVILSSALSLCFVFFRMYVTDSIIYGFLIWNLFLAWIPLAISNFLIKTESKFNSKIYNFSLYAIWLLFFPNCPYMITDIIHIVDIATGMPRWYDLIMDVTFAFSGMLSGLVSMYQIHNFLNKKMTRKNAWLVILFSILLSSFGVYLGRYQRWNSWDLFSQPITLFKGIFAHMDNPLANSTGINITILFSLLTLLGYFSFYALINYREND